MASDGEVELGTLRGEARRGLLRCKVESNNNGSEAKLCIHRDARGQSSNRLNLLPADQTSRILVGSAYLTVLIFPNVSVCFGGLLPKGFSKGAGSSKMAPTPHFFTGKLLKTAPPPRLFGWAPPEEPEPESEQERSPTKQAQPVSRSFFLLLEEGDVNTPYHLWPPTRVTGDGAENTMWFRFPATFDSLPHFILIQNGT
jgi:hypothetical protein